MATKNDKSKKKDQKKPKKDPKTPFSVPGGIKMINKHKKLKKDLLDSL